MFLKILSIILLSVILLFLVKPYLQSIGILHDKDLFFNGIDLYDGSSYEMTLVLPSGKLVWIDDLAGIQENRFTFEIKYTLYKYLPSGGPVRYYGATLYRNGKYINSKYTGTLNGFLGDSTIHYGTLPKYGKPLEDIMEDIDITDTKEEIINHLKSISDTPGIYYIEIPEMSEADGPYKVNVEFPSVLRMPRDRKPEESEYSYIGIDEQEFKDQAKEIFNNTKLFDGCQMQNINTSKNAEKDSIKIVYKNNGENYVRDISDNILTIENLISVSSGVSFRCTNKESSEILKQHNFNQYTNKQNVIPQKVYETLDRTLTENKTGLTRNDVRFVIESSETTVTTEYNPRKYRLHYLKKK
jgi:hypothetical protein